MEALAKVPTDLLASVALHDRLAGREVDAEVFVDLPERGLGGTCLDLLSPSRSFAIFLQSIVAMGSVIKSSNQVMIDRAK